MKKKVTILLIIALIIIAIVGVFIHITKNKASHDELVKTNPNSDKITVEDLKNELGATGKDDIYVVTEEYDGRKVLAIKPSLEYNVAVAGILNGEKAFEFEDIDNLIKSAPQENGIWISQNSRQNFTEMINELTNGEYYVDNNGYLLIEKEGNNNFDKAITDLIKGDKLYIIDINSKCYIIDSMTGNIEEYPFEKMDPYQTYQYFEYENKMAIILSENTTGKLTNAEIIDSLLKLCNVK